VVAVFKRATVWSPWQTPLRRIGLPPCGPVRGASRPARSTGTWRWDLLWVDRPPVWSAVRAGIRSFPEALRLVVSPIRCGRDLGAWQPHQRNPLLCFHVPERSVPVNRFFSTRAATSAPGAFGGRCPLLVSGSQGASGTQLLEKISKYVIFVIFISDLFNKLITNEIF